MQSVLVKFGYFFFWLALAVFATLTAFQLYGTLIAVAEAIVSNPSLRPYGWTTDTIYALGRLLWLILGILWLGWIMFTEGYLREGYQQQLLKKRTIRLTVILTAIYGLCLFVLLILR
jgi:hypothetical protein